MKNFSIILLIGLLAGSCYKRCNKTISCHEEGELRVIFENSSGEDLTDLKVGDRFVGNLEKGQSSCYLAYDTFGFDGDLPDEKCEATVRGKNVESYNRFYECGTNKFDKTKGDYEMKIKLLTIEGVDYLELKMK